MKKFLLIFSLMFLVIGCSNKNVPEYPRYSVSGTVNEFSKIDSLFYKKYVKEFDLKENQILKIYYKDEIHLYANTHYGQVRLFPDEIPFFKCIPNSHFDYLEMSFFVKEGNIFIDSQIIYLTSDCIDFLIENKVVK